jgi:hypothetical protein
VSTLAARSYRTGSAGWTQNRTALILFGAGLLIGGYQAFRPGFGFGRGNEMVSIARNLAATGTYGNPFPPAVTGPTAVVPPLYPVFLAGLIRLFGLSPLFVLVAELANVLVNAWIAALMPRLSRIFYEGPVPGVFAGVLWLFSMRLLPQWDVSYTVLGLVLFLLLSSATIERTSRAPLWASLAGLIAGLLTLANPATGLVSMPWLLYLVLSRRVPFQHALRYASVLVAVIGLCNLPWVIRNYTIWHEPVLRTNFGMTIYSSNNDCAQSSLFQNMANGCYQSTHPVLSEKESTLLKDLGELEYDRKRTADTFAWIRSHPNRFRQLTVSRVLEFWFPDGLNETLYAFWLSTILFVPGVIAMARRREPITAFVLFVSLLYPLMYYTVVSCDRYRYPILWASQLPAGYCAAVLIERIRSRRTQRGVSRGQAISTPCARIQS